MACMRCQMMFYRYEVGYFMAETWLAFIMLLVQYCVEYCVDIDFTDLELIFSQHEINSD